ncbi:MAG: DnaJ domain-containing protein [Nitrospinaceae bacterium]|nr:DnaJ domain-containing protein [Nitrospinaceae bacterium]NIR54174.1 DnaJ domain-containing protein [Nitrospinaceae bacterium]NIS84592.1 DnaJ domain-containing protein [Nitrospinaceae bacterium]NIT81384.1 DnaJ domain-containing protein [Nitrospinaceae bacterium]NIU43671.1 DnaJ domain-containing protein [Nitrospinaceae bacterium]
MKIVTDKDYYKILGVKKSAKIRDIKKRYRELARKHHPDTNEGSSRAEETFKRISEAYEVLGNAKHRKEYDRLRANRPHTRTASSHRSRKDAYTDPFDFGKQYARQGPREGPRDPFTPPPFEDEPVVDPDMPARGFDLQFMVEVPFVTAALGGQIPYTYEKHITCPDCGGTGLNPDQDECSACQGKQRVVEQVTFNVDIPSGVADQYTLRFRNEGGAGRNGGPPGDLMVKVCIQPHPHLKKIKKDIYSTVHISPELAEKGGSLEVQMLNRSTFIQVEEGTLTGEEYRIPGEGTTDRGGKTRGDFVVKFKIDENRGN